MSSGSNAGDALADHTPHNSPRPMDYELDDWTDENILKWNVALVVARAVDAAMAAALLLATAVIVLFTGLPFLLTGIQEAMKRLCKNFVGQETTVNALDSTYIETTWGGQVFNDSVIALMTQVPQDPLAERDVPLRVQRFLIVLCGIVYEDKKPHDRLLCGPQYGAQNNIREARVHGLCPPGSFMRRVVHEGCCVTIVGHGDLLVVAFKGTSPFNLNEWISDLSTSKVGATPELYELGCKTEGQLHEGFYRALFPEELPLGKGHPFSEIVAHCIDYAAEHEDVKLWVTGHSLGAAVASVFLTVLSASQGQRSAESIHREYARRIFAEMFKERLEGDHSSRSPKPVEEARVHAWRGAVRHLRDRLWGVCTFGTPRAMDSRLRDQVDDWLKQNGVPFHRVRNANDVVAEIPLRAALLGLVAWHMDKGAWEMRNNGHLSNSFSSVKFALDYAHAGKGVRVDHRGRVTEAEEVRAVKEQGHQVASLVATTHAPPAAQNGGPPGTAQNGHSTAIDRDPPQEAEVAQDWKSRARKAWADLRSAASFLWQVCMLALHTALSNAVGTCAHLRNMLSSSLALFYPGPSGTWPAHDYHPQHVARAALQSVLWPASVIYDHLPSEYYKHLHQAVQREG